VKGSEFIPPGFPQVNVHQLIIFLKSVAEGAHTLPAEPQRGVTAQGDVRKVRPRVREKSSIAPHPRVHIGAPRATA
jgi:hypothetical protein